MPWTFAHPAAVLPLRRWCPRWLNWPALVAGSLMPDLGYYLHHLELSRLMHRFPDGLAGCVLAGLMVLALFHALRRPLCQLLPQPHRGALLALIAARPAVSLRVLVSMMLSLALGAATHMAWDGLTHRGGWAVMQALALQEPLFYLWATGVPAYQVLQHLSTLIGIAALAWVYGRWLRHEGSCRSLRAHRHEDHDHREDRWRYRLLAAIAAAATIGALFSAAHAAMPSPGKFVLERFVFFFAVHGALAFAALFTAAALCYQRQRNRTRLSGESM